MSGLFDTFTIAKRGLSVQQANINTTSHNIANANTEGYSRQRAVAGTTRPFGGMSRFDSCSVGQVGTGAEITSIQRLRNKFLDYQVRNETGKLGNYDVSSKFLSEVEGVFGEPSDTGIQKLFSKFYAAFQEVAKTPEKSAARTVALQQCSALADALNSTSTQLAKKVTDAQELLQNNVSSVNTCLDEINELNKQISSVSAIGQTPNDLMDKRDNLLDKVSKMFGITVEMDKRETINLKADGFQKTGNVIDNLVNSEPTDDKYTRFSYVNSADLSADGSGKLTIVNLSYYPLGDSHATPKTITIDLSASATGQTDAKKLADSLMQNRILTANKDGDVTTRDTAAPYATKVLPATGATQNEVLKSIFKTYEVSKDSLGATINSVDTNNIKGEIAGNQAAQDMIKGYMQDLDRIAAALAYSVNAIQTATTGVGTPELLFINSANPTTDAGISAKTITVNKKIIDDLSLLNCGEKTGDGERAGNRAQAIADLITTKMDMSNIGDVSTLTRATFFTSSGIAFTTNLNNVGIKGSASGKTLDNYYKDMIAKLGTDSQEASEEATKQKDDILGNLQILKLEESGVSLDEETTNLIQFQHAYQANAKMIATIDELLDVVINGLKR